ncbi:MAG: hypothetical protein KDA85_16720, partial [Planctomycetaceae bacterium]|nr:hypothetical protein [Planctomycetaceae bacterium]
PERIDDQFKSIVQQALLIALGRDGSAMEIEVSLEFLRHQAAERQSRAKTDDEKMAATRAAVADYCQAVFGLNEFIYVD